MSCVKIPYGKKDDAILHISRVASGLGCGCVCVKCGGRLVAAKGEINAIHFKHKDIGECEGAAEYSICAMIRQLLKEKGKLTLPESRAIINGKDQIIIEEELVEITATEEISKDNAYAPEFILRTKSEDESERNIILRVKHGPDKKENEDVSKAIVCIDLDKLGGDYSKEHIIDALLNKTRCNAWISRPRAQAIEADLKQDIKKIQTTEEERDYLLSKGKNLGLVSGTKLNKDYPASKKSDPQKHPDSVTRSPQYLDISFSCTECGASGLTVDDMQRFQPRYATGVCHQCKGLRRDKALENNHYIHDFKRKNDLN